MRTIILGDIKDTHELYSTKDDVKVTDGAVYLNPIMHKLMIKITGDDYSTVSSASLKNVYYNYDILNDELTYMKFNHFPITEGMI